MKVWIFSVILAVSSLAHAGIKLNSNDVALLRLDGDVCSASLVGRNLVSASHCLAGRSHFTVVDPKRQGDDNDVEVQVQDVLSFPQNDIFVVPLRRNAGYKTLTLSSRRLTVGEPVSLEGYPGSSGDFLNHSPIKFNCIFEGPGLGYNSDSKLDMIVLAAKCPAIQDPTGLSGGPVLNSQGELVGVISNGMKTPRESSTYIFFSAIPAIPKSTKDTSLLFKDGSISFRHFVIAVTPSVFYDATFTFRNGLLNGPYAIFSGNGASLKGFARDGQLQP